jgi:hypothetical protein
MTILEIFAIVSFIQGQNFMIKSRYSKVESLKVIGTPSKQVLGPGINI